MEKYVKICVSGWDGKMATAKKKPGSGRPGGNPELVEFQFQQKGDEPFTERLFCRVSKSQKEKLYQFKNWSDLLRQWIDSLPDPPESSESEKA